MTRIESFWKSLWKAGVSTFVLALSAAVLLGAADFFLDARLLATVFEGKWVILIPVFNFVGQALKDWVKHNWPEGEK